MASTALERIRQQALGLTAVERAELAHDLVASLDGQPDPSASYEWDAEILKRLKQNDDLLRAEIDLAWQQADQGELVRATPESILEQADAGRAGLSSADTIVLA